MGRNVPSQDPLDQESILQSPSKKMAAQTEQSD